jgi:hypothetical protein
VKDVDVGALSDFADFYWTYLVQGHPGGWARRLVHDRSYALASVVRFQPEESVRPVEGVMVVDHRGIELSSSPTRSVFILWSTIIDVRTRATGDGTSLDLDLLTADATEPMTLSPRALYGGRSTSTEVRSLLESIKRWRARAQA